MSVPPTTVLVVDDQPLVRTGFALVIGSQPDMQVVAEAGDGHEAVEAARRYRPDVVLMDIRMPGMDGIEATQAIIAGADRDCSPRIIALTTYDTDDHALRMIDAGASGFLLKATTAEELLAAVRTVRSGDAVVAPSTTRRLLRYIAGRTPVDPPGPPPAAGLLTDRERTVLDHLVRGASNSEIARTLHLAEVTVKTHVGRVLGKLGLRDRVHVVIWAYETGYIARGGTAGPRQPERRALRGGAPP